MARVPFVDISEHQGTVDFAKMRAGGVDLVLPRAGINGRYDKRLDEYVNGAREAGVTVLGLYWFINPKSSAGPERQAELAIAACQKYGVRMFMYDLEGYVPGEAPPPALGGQAYMAWLERMDAPMRAAGIYRTVYTNASYWNPLYVGVGSDLIELDVIVATYPWYSATGAPRLIDGYPPDRWEERAFTAAPNGPLTPAGFDHWDAWQFSAGFNQQGPVYGCQSGDLDLNIADAEAVDRWLGTPLDPNQEDDMALSSEDKAWIVDAIKSGTKPSFDALWAVLTNPANATIRSMQQSVYEIVDQVNNKSDFINRIAAAVVAATPPASVDEQALANALAALLPAGATVEQVRDLLRAVNLTIDFQTP